MFAVGVLQGPSFPALVMGGNDAPSSQYTESRPPVHFSAQGTELRGLSSFGAQQDAVSSNHLADKLTSLEGKPTMAGMCLAFKDIKYTVRCPDPETKKMVDRDILQGCTGMIRPGSLNAIMGASGGGLCACVCECAFVCVCARTCAWPHAV